MLCNGSIIIFFKCKKNMKNIENILNILSLIAKPKITLNLGKKLDLIALSLVVKKFKSCWSSWKTDPTQIT